MGGDEVQGVGDRAAIFVQGDTSRNVQRAALFLRRSSASPYLAVSVRATLLHV